MEGGQAARLTIRQQNRMNNLEKKLGELITLCGTEGFLICSSTSSTRLKSWPEDLRVLLPLVQRYRSLSQRGMLRRKPASRKLRRGLGDQIKKPAWMELMSHKDHETNLNRILRFISGHEKLNCLTVQQLREVLDRMQHVELIRSSDLEVKEREVEGGRLLDLLGNFSAEKKCTEREVESIKLVEKNSSGAMEEGGEKEEEKSCLVTSNNHFRLFIEGEELESLEVMGKVATSIDEKRWKEIDNMKIREDEIQLSFTGEQINSMKLVAKFASKAGEKRMEGSRIQEGPDLDLSLNFNH